MSYHNRNVPYFTTLEMSPFWLMLIPADFANWEVCCRIPKAGEAEAGSAGEQPAKE